ncbi:tetratricopeptide repeat protein [Streptoalloteichus hindustanus]|uniref:NB-ARC domain-containing protein n=1 Tax=Streptoalloteichus hindustanus TaxID=2017 RepID=A0A1M5DA19_STRHI|nr:tetratricopeptide repeat protein [Streptoalloteichus hindustanus]SHF63824.1 NB-ARC domain-containing protein [Streptoalloteichus hindustanus]
MSHDQPRPPVNQVTAHTIGLSIQAGDIHGGLHLHSPAPHQPHPVPRQLPLPPPVLLGRDRELTQLDTWAGQRSDPMLVVITGPAGIGKTALAVHWLTRRAKESFPDGQLYVDLAGTDPVQDPLPPSDVLGAFLRALGHPPQHLPVGLEGRAALYRALTADKALAVLLDRPLSAAQVRPLLPGSPRSAVLVASRATLSGLTLDGARKIALSPLAPDAAHQVLRRGAGPRADAEPEALRQIVGWCAGLPHTLALLAAHLTVRRHLTLGQLATTLSATDPTSGVIPVMYEELSFEAQQAHRLLALHPGPAYHPDAAAALLGIGRDRAGQVLAELTHVRLLDQHHGRLRQPEPVRVDALDRVRAQDTVHTRLLAVRRVVEWYLDHAVAAAYRLRPTRAWIGDRFQNLPTTQAGAAETVAWLEAERVNLTTATLVAAGHGWHTLTWQLCEALWPLWLHTRHHLDWARTHLVGIAAARHDAHPAAEARLRTQLAHAYLDQHRHTEAHEHITPALELARQAGHQAVEATALEQLGALAHARGQHTRALTLMRQALAMAEHHGHPRAAALRRAHVGRILLDLGQHRDAIGELTTARRDLEALADGTAVARVLRPLALAHHHAGDTTHAVLLLHRARDLLGSIGAHHDLGAVYHLLGDLAEGAGDAAAARAHWRQALHHYQAIAHRDAAVLKARLGVQRHVPKNSDPRDSDPRDSDEPGGDR